MTTEPTVPDPARLDRLDAVLRLPRLRPTGPAPTQRDAKRLLREVNRAYVRTHALLQQACARDTGATAGLGDVQANAWAATALLARAQALPLTRAGLRARQVAWDNECVAGEALHVAGRTSPIPAGLLKRPSKTQLSHGAVEWRWAFLQPGAAADSVHALVRGERRWIKVPDALRELVALAAEIQSARRRAAPELVLHVSPRSRTLRALHFEA